MVKKIIGGSLEECVHVAGISNYFKLAELAGYETIFLGPAISNEKLILEIIRNKPDVVAVSYRLTPENALVHLEQLKKMVEKYNLQNIKFFFGGTPPVVEEAKKVGLFDNYFVGSEDEIELLQQLKGKSFSSNKDYPGDVLSRIDFKKPFPLLRAHFGLPSLEATINGVRQIANAKALDVISLGTDQDAQANFYHPNKQSIDRKGAGGVPVRSADDFKKLYEASRTGNFPLMRTYAGTDDLVKLAQVYKDTINNAWSAVPIFWFNKMDGRGPHSLEESIAAHLDLIRWNVQNNVPVEILESHHWSMRDAPDEVAVASAFLGAYISKELGVKNFIQQYMFNTPMNTSFTNDLAKMLATKELISEFVDSNFKVYHQTRAGLVSFPANINAGYGQLASSTMLQLQLNPDIIHIVNYCEAYHAAKPEDVIASSDVVKQVIKNHLNDTPDMTKDSFVQFRKDELKDSARKIVYEIVGNQLSSGITPKNLAKVVTNGVFDAPQLKNNPYALAKIKTVMVDGGCVVDNYKDVMKN